MLSLPTQHPFTVTVLWEHRAIEISLTVLPGYEAWDLGFIFEYLSIQTALRFHRFYLPKLSNPPSSFHLYWYPHPHLSSERLHLPLPGVLASTPFPPIHCTSCSQSGVLYSADVSILFNTFWWLHIRINFTEDKLSALYCGRSLFVWQRLKIQAAYILALWSQASYLTPLCLNFLTAQWS